MVLDGKKVEAAAEAPAEKKEKTEAVAEAPAEKKEIEEKTQGSGKRGRSPGQKEEASPTKKAGARKRRRVRRKRTRSEKRQREGRARSKTSSRDSTVSVSSASPPRSKANWIVDKAMLHTALCACRQLEARSAAASSNNGPGVWAGELRLAARQILGAIGEHDASDYFPKGQSSS